MNTKHNKNRERREVEPMRYTPGLSTQTWRGLNKGKKLERGRCEGGGGVRSRYR